MSDAWPPAPRPSAESVQARQRVLEAARTGDAGAVVAATGHHDDRVRASAYRMLAELGHLTPERSRAATADPAIRVRRTLAELAAQDDLILLDPLLDDPDPSVVEWACWAAGERGGRAAALVPRIAALSADHDDALCREAGVAALGAIGDVAGLPAILAATHDRATVRRRAVIALAPFESPEVTEALERALQDRDWQVRQAAEDLIGHS